MERKYRDMFGEVHASDRLKQEVLNMTKQKRSQRRHIPLAALIAAVLVVVLAGTALAMTNAGIRDWFAQHWREETGRVINVDQLGMIDQLTQEIGAGDTCNGVTVTVDSVTRGESILWMLLEIDGLEITPEEASGSFFADMGMSITPQPESMESFGYDFEEAGFRENGALMVLLRYLPLLTEEDTLLDACNVELRLGSFTLGERTVVEGTWNISFSLEKADLPESLTLENRIRVPALPLDTPEERPEVEFRDVRITPTELHLVWADPEMQEKVMAPGYWSLLMKDGAEISHCGGVGYDLPDGRAVKVYYWKVPIDLTQVEALKFGELVFPLH